MADTRRRARGEDSIFFAPNRKCWVGEITVGWNPTAAGTGSRSGGRPDRSQGPAPPGHRAVIGVELDADADGKLIHAAHDDSPQPYSETPGPRPGTPAGTSHTRKRPGRALKRPET